MRTVKYVIISLVAFSLLFGSLTTLTGCGAKKPNQEELSKLEEARAAAEAAEKKLADLKAERMSLEQDLEKKKEELRKAQEERDNTKQKLGQ
jgi:septal ring factor EnvC (AmiA/AmiB activator)